VRHVWPFAWRVVGSGVAVTAVDMDALTAEVTAIDARLTVEEDRGVFVLRGPRSTPTCAEVAALRLLEAYTPAFVFRPELDCS
jgi:hypothetical protein